MPSVFDAPADVEIVRNTAVVEDIAFNGVLVVPVVVAAVISAGIASGLTRNALISASVLHVHQRNGNCIMLAPFFFNRRNRFKIPIPDVDWFFICSMWWLFKPRDN